MVVNPPDDWCFNLDAFLGIIDITHLAHTHSHAHIIAKKAMQNTHTHTQTFLQMGQTCKLHSLVKFPEVSY